MKYLSLFSGGGGGELACEHLLGWTCAGRAEWGDGARAILERRVATGHLTPAPLWRDVREVPELDVDVVVGGFPCQPFSSAGKRLADDDPRNGWPWMLDVVRRCRPRHVWGENVRGLLSSGYFGEILGDLLDLGYGVRWALLGASDVGALHRRHRLWIVASRDVKAPDRAPLAVRRGGEWTSAQRDLFAAAAAWGEWPVAGVAVGGLAWSSPAVHGLDGIWPTANCNGLRGGHNTPQRLINKGIDPVTLEHAWPTPTVQAAKHSPSNGWNTAAQGRQINLSHAVGMAQWPTPSTQEGAHRPQNYESRAGNHLLLFHAVGMNHPTPTSRDWKDGAHNPNVPVNGLLGRAVWQPGSRDVLNPDWVEWLMGWPVGWTDTARDTIDPIRPLHLDPHPEIPRLAPRTSQHKARLHALGNGWVPQCGAAAWRLLTEET
jgi:site-specific DNA-cytosine methylase